VAGVEVPSSSERAPDFFIVGAPKCGTTALSEYLRQHPDVFLSTPKEPFFFCEDFTGVRRPRTWDAYRRLFRRAPEGAIAGEASAMYLYSEVAIANIRRRCPGARLIALFRNPVDLAQAFHSEMVYGQNEDELDFVRAWDLQADRRKGVRLPPQAWEPRFLQYRAVASLGSQLERLLSVFPADQVLTLLFDDYVRDTAGAYERVLAFLGVAPDGRREFPAVNENKRIRRRGLARWTQRPPAAISRAVASAKRAVGLERVHLLGPLRRANLERTPREPLPTDFRRRLIGEFDGEIELLARLLRRDLSSWRT